MKIKELEEYLNKKKLFNDHQWESGFISLFADQTVLNSLIRSVLEDEFFLEKVRRHSCQHPLGFAKIVFADYREFSYMLRLHIWKRNDQTQEILTHHIHNHWCDFYSVILRGKLTFSVFRETFNGEMFLKYSNPLVDGNYQFNQIGIVGLEKILEMNIAAGSKYFMSQPTIHYVDWQVDSTTATMVLQCPNTATASVVYTKKSLTEESISVPQIFSPEELKKILTEFIGQES